MELGRIIRDDDGTEWEVFDESDWGARMALDWDYLPQTHDFGLIFNSRLGCRRVFPCPADWQQLSDAQLMALCAGATNLQT